MSSQPAERFTASLVFEYFVGELEGLPDAVTIDVGTCLLNNHIQKIVLKIFGNARNHGHTNQSQQKQRNSLEELSRFGILYHRNIVDHLAHDQRVHHGKPLVNGGKKQGEQEQFPISLQVGE
jgi:hypothetical protein